MHCEPKIVEVTAMDDDAMPYLLASGACALCFAIGLLVGYHGSAWKKASSERDRCAAIAVEQDESLEVYRECVKGSESWNRSPKR